MNKAKAVKMAIEALEQERRRLAFDAALWDKYRDEAHKKVSQQRQDITQAIVVLKGMLDDKP